MCDARTTGIMPKCEKCHPCSNQWDSIILELERNLTNYVSGSNVSSPGAIYDKELEILKRKLKELEEMVNNRTITEEEVNKFRKELAMFRKSLTGMTARVAPVFRSLENTTQRNMKADEELDRLSKHADKLVAKVVTKLLLCSSFLGLKEETLELDQMSSYTCTLETLLI